MRFQFIILTLLVAISGVLSKGKKLKPKPNNWLVLIGGAKSEDSDLSTLEMLSYFGVCPKPVTIPELDAETSKGESVWADKSLVFCGGAQEGQHANKKCFSIDKPDEPKWEPFAAEEMQSARALFSLTVMNDSPYQLLAVGGVSDTGSCLNTIEKYTFPYTNFKTMDYTLPSPICGHCAVQLGRKSVMIIGGAEAFNDDSSKIVPTDKVWNINTNKLGKRNKKHVKQLEPLIEPLWRPACVRRGGFVYVSGGLLDDDSASKFIYRYNIKTNNWIKLTGSGLNTGRYGHRMGNTAANQMVVAGGYNKDVGYLNSIEDTYNNGVEWTNRRQTLGEEREYAAMTKVPPFKFNCD